MVVSEIAASHGILVPCSGGGQKLDSWKEVRLGSLDDGVQRLDSWKESRLMAW